MRKKSILALVLAGCLAGLSLTGCSSKGNSSDVGNDSSNTPEGKTKLKAIIVKHSLTKDVTQMKWLAEIEEKANVEIEWQQISADWDQKKSALFASGEIPDLLFNATSNSDFVQFNGLFEDLGPLIEKDAPNIQKMFSEHPELKTLATQIDGKLYGTPRYKGIWPGSTASMFINKTWLDNLGLQVPTNWDELETVLLAFRDGDPNQNGDKTDEIPMDFNPIGWDFTPKLLLGSLGLPLSNGASDGYFTEGAQVKNFYVDERFKTLMQFLQKLYSQNLISKEVVTQDYSKYQSVARGNGATAKVGFTWGWETGDRFGNELKDQYVTLPQLKQHADSTDELYWSNDYYYQNYGSNAVSVSARSKNKEAAMRFIDGFYEPVVSLQVLFGGMNDTDKGIKDNGDGTYAILPPADASLDPGSWKWTNSFADNGPMYIADALKDKVTLGSDMQNVLKEKAVYDELLNKADEKSNVYPQNFMKYSTEDTNTLAMNQANVNNITDQKWATWLTTKVDIEKEWAAYVASVNSSGLEQNLQIRQKAYDEYLSTLK
ncbi:ABC transporter substrate-binding protein [Paenibacillus sp. FSL P4-0338]|uniref:ABC transporter substrate-binding protein n=1 Tax=unclassified Paenibacillus TaxID=185978 RepID=UPI0003E27877|nr:ABC transporter substrate-binding protein [Paenibacillus sp. FSL R7-269]ETT45606.1 family 1 extracellular solute-binding protein [Paenibacillus sp. FSL R7-269]